MKGQLNHLVRLQEIDSQLIRITAQKSSHSKQLEDARRPLDEARKGLDQVRSSMDAASKAKRDKERDLQAQEELITKLKSRQTDIKTNKEYHALLQELETAKGVKGRLEEDLLILMDGIDNGAKNQKQFEYTLEEATKAFQLREKGLADEAGRFDEAIKSLEAERAGVIGQLDGKLRNSYERLKRDGKGLAVVPVIGESCGGCHMSIPPQLVAEVKLETSLHTCSHCHRILYWESPAAKSGSPNSVPSVP